MKTIGLLTSGGDAPGMNACIAAIAARAERCGVELRGMIGGFQGLAQASSIPIGSELSGLARRGGSFLGTTRNGNVEEELVKQGVATALARCCVDGLIVLGGGRSLGAAARLAEAGAAIVGIPCTIDNDVYGTDYCLGFDSAVSKALRAADEIMDTAESLSERVFLIEVLGGKTGHLAVAAAYATAADAVFVHEVKPDIEAAALKVKAKMDDGGTHGLIFLTEHLGLDEIAAEIEEKAQRRVRTTVLGHIMRGGNPTFPDRIMARAFGERALDMLLAGDTGKMVKTDGCDIGDIPLSEIAGKTRELAMANYEAVWGK